MHSETSYANKISNTNFLEHVLYISEQA